jgi:hypothetical protein
MGAAVQAGVHGGDGVRARVDAGAAIGRGGGGGLQPDGDGAGRYDPIQIVDSPRERQLGQPEGGVDLAQADERDRDLQERRLTALA